MFNGEIIEMMILREKMIRFHIVVFSTNVDVNCMSAYACTGIILKYLV